MAEGCLVVSQIQDNLDRSLEETKALLIAQ